MDKLEMVLQAFEYESEGHSRESLQEFWDNASKYLSSGSLAKYFRQLESLRR